MLQNGNIRLMVLGAIREGGAGCACSDNAVLKALLNTLLLSQNEDIVVDMEAGVEPLGRGTIAPVDHLLIVVQPYLGSLETAKKILRLAKDIKRFQMGIIANLVSSEGDIQYIEENLGIKPLSVFYQSESIKIAEREKIPVYEASNAFKSAAYALVRSLGVTE
jgi:CO dehydrogenase maturation factor